MVNSATFPTKSIAAACQEVIKEILDARKARKEKAYKRFRFGMKFNWRKLTRDMFERSEEEALKYGAEMHDLDALLWNTEYEQQYQRVKKLLSLANSTTDRFLELSVDKFNDIAGFYVKENEE